MNVPVMVVPVIPLIEAVIVIGDILELCVKGTLPARPPHGNRRFEDVLPSEYDTFIPPVPPNDVFEIHLMLPDTVPFMNWTESNDKTRP